MSNTKISIQFLGAAGTVTGSKHLLKTPEKNILIDCGLFQGIKSLRLKNREPLPVDEKTIDILLLTHAHLDHCGYIPLFVKNGFKGKILMTPPTRDLVEIILRDSAKIQEEEARKANEEGYSKHSPAIPLYTEKDVEIALKHFEIRHDIDWVPISENISFRYLKNGHILGSAFIEMKCFGRKIVFTGDIGRTENALLAAPSVIEEADCLIMESTYGDRLHPAGDPADELEEIILHTLEKGGTLLIPSFAVERAQELMFIINKLKQEKRIPNLPVYLDSPMGTDTTDIFMNHPNWHKLNPTETYSICKHTQFIRDFQETLKLIKDNKPKIIIAASGMLTGGRVLSYLSVLGKDSKNTVLLVGFQGEGTRGRALKEGIKEIKLHGKYYQIEAEIMNISSMSGHADQLEMINWLKKFKKKPKQLFMVHGEPQAQNIFRVKIKDELAINATIPQLYEEFSID
jgi:metallo-beta-lactamase family protein